MAKLTYESTSKFVKAGDVTLHYHEAGEGEPLLLMHGGSPGASAWTAYWNSIEPLSRRFRVMTVDCVGYGASDKPPPPRGVSIFKHLALPLRNMLDELGIEKTHMGGISLGGGTTLRFALEFPDRVDGLCLIGPGGAMLPMMTPFGPYQQLSERLGPWRQDPSPDKSLQWLKDLIHPDAHDQITQEIIDQRYQNSIDPDHVKFTESMYGGGVAGLSAEEAEKVTEERELWRHVHKIQNRALLFLGRQGLISLDAAFFILTRMPNLSFFYANRSSNYVQVDYPELFADLLHSFLVKARDQHAVRA